MFARFVDADIVVANLTFERGREVREFVERNRRETRRRAVIIASTSDRSPIEQIKSTYVATTIAESFRDEGKRVLLLVDGLTRLALRSGRLVLQLGNHRPLVGTHPLSFRSCLRCWSELAPAKTRATSPRCTPCSLRRTTRTIRSRTRSAASWITTWFCLESLRLTVTILQ